LIMIMVEGNNIGTDRFVKKNVLRRMVCRAQD
jgi:hypothetical protein